MNKSELIRELRELTQAGMKDCNDALQEAGMDLQKAVDIIKTKGKNIVSGRSGKAASEGRVDVAVTDRGFAMVEVNSQTDFVANSPEFKDFTAQVAGRIAQAINERRPFDVAEVETSRAELVARTKENIVVRRWWIQEVGNPNAMVTQYIHGSKIGVLLTVLASDEKVLSHPDFSSIAQGLAMQVAAMNPIAVSPYELPPDVVARQKSIFETQLRELKKPEASWAKILEGKFNKWYTEVCLLNQESIMVPKVTVKQYLDDLGKKMGGEIQVVHFIRCQVGEGVEKPQEQFADEVGKLI